MSKVIGIIAEYNPFHNGHLYHLQKSLQMTHSSYSVAVVRVTLHKEVLLL